MKPLEPMDRFHLEAAKGWIELGNRREATREAEGISAVNCAHPEVLRLRWRLCAMAKNWGACLEIAQRLKAMTPDHQFGWLHEAMSLEKLGRVDEAKQAMHAAIEHFGSDSTLAFHMACHSALAGQLEEARAWVGKAIDVAEDQEDLDRLRLQVLGEPVLEAMWTELQGK